MSSLLVLLLSVFISSVVLHVFFSFLIYVSVMSFFVSWFGYFFVCFVIDFPRLVFPSFVFLDLCLASCLSYLHCFSLAFALQPFLSSRRSLFLALFSFPLMCSVRSPFLSSSPFARYFPRPLHYSVLSFFLS